MKWFLNIFGALLILTGLVWILQGVNVLGGSYMSGRIEYSGLGVVVLLIGIGLLFWGFTRGRLIKK